MNIPHRFFSAWWEFWQLFGYDELHYQMPFWNLTAPLAYGRKF
jgi:hypothetical protein